MNLKTSIASKMKEAGGFLKEGGCTAGRSLRIFQKQLKETARPDDDDLIFLIFFIDIFIDDLFFNLSGDFPYHAESYEIIHLTFKNIGAELINLADKLELDIGKGLFDSYKEMAIIYKDCLLRIEDWHAAKIKD